MSVLDELMDGANLAASQGCRPDLNTCRQGRLDRSSNVACYTWSHYRVGSKPDAALCTTNGGDVREDRQRQYLVFMLLSRAAALVRRERSGDIRFRESSKAAHLTPPGRMNARTNTRMNAIM